MKRMTAARLRTLTKPGRYRAGQTLYLFVTARGGRSWVQRLVVEGRRRDIGLGPYPEVSLAEARQRAHDNRMAARRGEIPPARARRPPTFMWAVKQTHEANHGRWSKQTAGAWLGVLERYALPALGDRRVDKIERSDVLRVLTPIWTERPAIAKKLRGAIRTVLAWALAYGHVETNYAGEAIDGALPTMPAVRAHHRALPYAKVGLALSKVAASTASLPVRACVRFIAVTGVRSSEARQAKWAEIDLQGRTWTVPASRMKTRTEHRVPLSNAAIEVLESVRVLHSPADYVFPSPSKPIRPVACNLTRVLQAVGLDTTVHGFRSSLRTWAAEQTSYPHAVCEMALAHRVGGDVERSYVRTDLFKKRRQLMADWAAYVAGGGARRRARPGARRPLPAGIDRRDHGDHGDPDSGVAVLWSRPVSRCRPPA